MFLCFIFLRSDALARYVNRLFDRSTPRTRFSVTGEDGQLFASNEEKGGLFLFRGKSFFSFFLVWQQKYWRARVILKRNSFQEHCYDIYLRSTFVIFAQITSLFRSSREKNRINRQRTAILVFSETSLGYVVMSAAAINH